MPWPRGLGFDAMGFAKPIVGLCGGIGAGKSSVAREFERLGCLVIDSDRLNHEVLARPEVLAKLREWWGDEVVGADGRPDRKRIASIVFEDAGQRRRLEDLVHPLIVEMHDTMIGAAGKDRTVQAVILDSPLLFESNLASLCDFVVFVEASRAERLRRLHQARGWDEGQLQRRERWQEPVEAKRSRAEFLIQNDGPAVALRAQVTGVLEQIIARYPQAD